MNKPEKTILIVEDEPQNRKLFRDVLRFKGYATIEATDGQQGVEMAKKFLPDLILMDMNLPVMDGLEATAILIHASTTRHIPIIAITAYAMPGDKERILAAGCRGYISKPVHIADLVEQVARFFAEPDAGTPEEGESS
ncbi:response regulator [Desulfatirhabdium butyrativorans]|uniref:response regulator n=1 Tax=Desulfatirhabdium butyrativorans TaxID=340467 RepID=UPI00040D1DD3|nr:response regulator [Desulfatirhabdium butyrativorans]